MSVTHIQLSELVLDFSLYPRHDVDKAHLSVMSEAFQAGAEFPPVVADADSKQVIDGFHRVRTYQRHLDPTARVKVELRSYADDAERFKDAMASNASHGRALTPYDQARCVARSQELGLTVEVVATALHMRVERLQDLALKKTAIPPKATLIKGKPTATMPIRRTAMHLAGKQLTEKQYEAHKHTTGLPQMMIINQLVNLLEGDLFDWDNEALTQRLRHLHGLLQNFFGK